MSAKDYRPDPPTDTTDLMILTRSGPEPRFDPVMRGFLLENYNDLKSAVSRGGLLKFSSLGLTLPWLYRLTFSTSGYVRDAQGEVETVGRQVVALRIPPDYLRRADRFAMLRLVEPSTNAFHPNISPTGAICVQLYAGEPLVEICHSLHDLFRWRLRQYDERDALNPSACAWGRENVEQPIDPRPLFGSGLKLEWDSRPLG